MNSNPEPSSAMEERRMRLRQLEHDVKNCLGVVTMGLQALEISRDDPTEFADLYKSVVEEGVQPLRGLIASIIEVACPEAD